MIAGVFSSDSSRRHLGHRDRVERVRGGGHRAHERLVAQRQERVHHVEVPRVERHVVRLADRAARRVELRERLRELHEVLEVVVGRVAPLDPFAHERAAVDGEKTMWLPPICTVRSGLRACSVELARGLRHLLEDPVGVELHELALDLLARLLEVLERLLVQELDPELADDPPPAALELLHRGLVEDLVARQLVDQHVPRLQSIVRVEQLSSRVEPGVAGLAHLERQPELAAARSACGAQLGRRLLREPDDPRVVAEVVVAQLGMAVEPERCQTTRSKLRTRKSVRKYVPGSSRAARALLAREDVVAVAPSKPRVAPSSAPRVPQSAYATTTSSPAQASSTAARDPLGPVVQLGRQRPHLDVPAAAVARSPARAARARRSDDPTCYVARSCREASAGR